MTGKTSGFGIGEAGKSPASTIEDELEAERLQPTRGEGWTCPHCGSIWPSRKHTAMSSASGICCPNCYDECEGEG